FLPSADAAPLLFPNPGVTAAETFRYPEQGLHLAAWGAAAGTAVSAMSSANAAVTMVLILHAATPL
ncbi:M56 family peptidase, partial [Streptomyces massasporeus]